MLDSEEDAHLFILDVTSSNSFVYDQTTLRWPYIGFDFEHSKTFKNLSEPFEYEYRSTYNDEDSNVAGYTAEDVFENGRGEFGLPTKVNGEPSRNFDELYTDGRIGFARFKGNRTSIRDTLLKNYGYRKLWLAIRVYPNVLVYVIGLGHNSKKDAQFLIANAKQQDSNSDLWSFPVTSIKTGYYNVKTNISAVVSSTSYFIKLPTQYFNGIGKKLNMKYDHTIRRYIGPCNQNVNITFGINDREVTIPFEYYTDKLEDLCQLNLMAHDKNVIVFGRPIYMSHAVGFDFETNDLGIYTTDIIDNDDTSFKSYTTRQDVRKTVVKNRANDAASSVIGYTAEDVFESGAGGFGVPTKLRGKSPSKVFNGDEAEGRIGFARFDGQKNSVRDALFEYRGYKKLWLAIEQRSVITVSSVRLGHTSQKDDQLLIAKAKQDNANNFWSFPVSSIKTSNYNVKTDISAIVSSTSYFIKLPLRYFTAVINKLNVKYDRDIGRYVGPCDQDLLTTRK
ncbi:unnamed protein product [Bursaphelenchus okinawaensis]|uniref:Peptidase A1 domain-containing protein n=1 Tax=Bursaphelenchus okinawaensis TaxID=465554 RepID=A0A811KZU5_9BILA|nr:unnamed protein product [Bursaphelenchus okinawaensis]CAG9113645.1 unnamed protein product [Bursaphelenchus okinawaensis]